MAKDIDNDFMDELSAATRMKPSFSSNLMLFSITALIGALIFWSTYFEIEEITHGSGKVVPTQEVQIVQSLEGGVLEEILVQEGDLVEQGQVLLKVSDVAFVSEEKGTEVQSMALRAKKNRLLAEANGTEFKIDDDIVEKYPDIARNEKSLYMSRQEELRNAKSILDAKIRSAKSEIGEVNAKINRLSGSKSDLNKELTITREMVAKRAIPKLEQMRLERELNDIAGKIREASQERSGLNAELARAQEERKDKEAQFKSKVLGELNEVEAKIAQLDQSLTEIGDRVSRTEIRSPVSGIVNKVTIKTIGGVVEPAKPLLEIVPADDDLKITAKVLPQEIAFLKPNQPVNIKISAYDSQRYGSLPGKLTRVGANSVTDNDNNVFFEVEVEAEKNYLGTEEKPLPITSGMVADIEVITGKRTIMSYLMKPVLRTRDKALTER